MVAWAIAVLAWACCVMAKEGDEAFEELNESIRELRQVAQSVAAQTQALAALQDGEKHLLRLQETLQHNLAALNGAGAFEQAVHSLTAAIHLLTARGAYRVAVSRP